jgi:glyoxylase-like metal-dependent hydrolase (beta-lactamase superfamily II)
MWISKNRRKLKVEELKIQGTGGGQTSRLPLRRYPSALISFWRSLFPVTFHLTPVLASCLLVTAFCFLLPGQGLSAASGLYQVQEVKPNVYVWVPDDVIDQECDPQFSRAATAGFILTSDGVVVVDTANSPFHGRELLYEIRKRTEMPVKYVINTTSAADHILGNEVFTDEQAALISTTTAQSEMQQYRQELFDRLQAEDGWRLQARMRGFHVTPATQTFDREMTLNVGDREIRLVSLLRDETSSEDAAVYVPSAKTLFLGDFYDNHYFPRIGSHDVRRWIELLRQVEGWDVDTYVPGHGAPGSKKDLADFRGFLEWLVAQVEMRLKEGKSAEDVQKHLSLPKIYAWHAPELAAGDVDAVCQQLGARQVPSRPARPSRP